MANYVIHACPERMWYVDDYLVPSMEAQGIKNVDVRCDTDHVGNLENCMQIFGSMDNTNDGAWHLQDDVIVCHDFKQLTEKYDFGIVCGFSKSKSTKVGYVDHSHMWWSFPCIRIPNYIAKGCADWFYSFAKSYAKYYEWVYMKKCDDNFFKEYLKTKLPGEMVLNLDPNLVDHVDYLIGGSIVNRIRGDEIVRSAYFRDSYLVDNLQKELIKKRG